MPKKVVEGQFRYQQDSKRYHRFQVQADEGIVGTIYVPKDNDGLPEKLNLVYAKQDE